MIIDKQNLFSEDQAVTVTAASTNVIDLGDANALVPTPYEEGGIEVNCQVTTAFAGGTSLKVSLQVSDSSTFSSAVTLYETAAILTASLVAGYKFKLMGIPEHGYQYSRLYYTVVGTMSAGNIHGALVIDRQTNG